MEMDRRKFLALLAISPVIFSQACRDDKKTENTAPLPTEKPPLHEWGTKEDFVYTFFSLYNKSLQDGQEVQILERWGGPKQGIVEFEFDGGDVSGKVRLEHGFKPSNLMELFFEDPSAMIIDKFYKTESGTRREMAATWQGTNDVWRFVPAEKITDPNGPVVEPHKMTAPELGYFLASTWADFNAVRVPQP